MKCKYCEIILKYDSNLILNYFYHLENNHYEELDDEDRIMHDTRKKMIESKQNYELQKKLDGDSDLIFNDQNSDI
jgi:hypothetical protein